MSDLIITNLPLDRNETCVSYKKRAASLPDPRLANFKPDAEIR